MATATQRLIAQIEANTARIQEAEVALRATPVLGPAVIQASIGELVKIATSDDDRETRIRLVTEFGQELASRTAGQSR